MSVETLPYQLVYGIAFIISGVVLYHSWKNRNAPGVRAFAIAVIFEISWLLGYTFELNSNSIEAKIFWDNFQYIGALYAPIAILIFALRFVGRKVNARRLSIILSILPTFVLIAIFANTNPELIRENIQILPGTPFDELSYDFGPIANLGNYFLYALSLAYIIAFFTGFRRKERNFRSQLALILIGIGIPTVGLIVAQFTGLKFANQRDVSPLFFVISNVVIAFGIFRFRLFNLLPVAREALFETIEDLLIILDVEDRIVDANAPARNLLFANQPNLEGTAINTLMPELFEEFGDVKEIHAEIPGENNTAYDLKITPLYDRSNRFLGRLINAHDITHQKNAEKEIQAQNKKNERRAAQFQAIANVANSTTTLQNQEQAFSQITETISKELGHYHTGIFLLDDSGNHALFRAANSLGGKEIIEKGFRININEPSIVGNVARTGIARVVQDTEKEDSYLKTEELAETRSEIALPLILDNKVIGILDVQSKVENAFTEDDVETLNILANQVSAVIQNTRLYEENIIALQNAEKISKQLSGEAWAEVFKTQNLKGYIFDGATSQPLTESQVVSSTSVPVMIHGKKIGTLKLSGLDPDREWTNDEIAMVTAAAERAALALENARLLEDAQRRASREQTIGDISTRISAASEIETVLRTTVEELGRRLSKAGDVMIEITDTATEKETFEAKE